MERNMMDTQGTTAGPVGSSTVSSTVSAADANNASLGRLFRDLADDISDLTRKEIELARTETMEKVSNASKAVISMAAGGFIAYAGLLFLLSPAVLVFSTWVP